MHYLRFAFVSLVMAMFLTVAGCGNTPVEDPAVKDGVGGQYKPASQFDSGPKEDKKGPFGGVDSRPDE